MTGQTQRNVINNEKDDLKSAFEKGKIPSSVHYEKIIRTAAQAKYMVGQGSDQDGRPGAGLMLDSDNRLVVNAATTLAPDAEGVLKTKIDTNNGLQWVGNKIAVKPEQRLSVEWFKALARNTPEQLAALKEWLISAGEIKPAAVQLPAFPDASEGTRNTSLGAVLALNHHGNVMVIGGEQANECVYIVGYKNGQWEFMSTTSTVIAGCTVAVNAQGTSVAIGFKNTMLNNHKGSVVFKMDENDQDWKSFTVGHSTLGPEFGASVAFNAAGDLAVIGAPAMTINGTATNAGAVFISRYTQAGWSIPTPQEAITAPTPQASGFFGDTVALSYDGNVLIVGAPRYNNKRGRIYVLKLSEGHFIHTQMLEPGPATLQPDDKFAESISLSADGRVLAVSCAGENSNTGAVYIYRRETIDVNFTLDTKLTGASGNLFGARVALSADSRYLMVSHPEAKIVGIPSGIVWWYGWDEEEKEWVENGELKMMPHAAVARFGQGMAISGNGNQVAVGSPNFNSGKGNVTLFE
ncbi:TPA: hypothetical protein QH957_002285 [Enterobacter bugandensis]|nr:hypothetical protein [Enterobacter bugandensis]